MFGVRIPEKEVTNPMRSFLFAAVSLVCFSASSGEALILYTSDNGDSWIREKSGTSSNLNCVSVDIMSGTILAVGDNGTILRRGEEEIWVDVSPEGLSADLYSVSTGIAGSMACGEGGTLLSSFDGGLSWRIWTDFECGNVNLLSVNFDPTHLNTFLITGEDGFVHSSEERGIVATDFTFDCVASCVTLCSGFPDQIIGSNGSGFSLRSESEFSIGNSLLRGATEIVSGSGRYIAVGDSGSLFRYSEENVWESIPTLLEEDLNDVSYLSWGSSACAVGNNGAAMKSNDNGITWTAIDSGTNRDLTSISGNGAGTACIVGKNALSGFSFLFGLLPE